MKSYNESTIRRLLKEYGADEKEIQNFMEDLQKIENFDDDPLMEEDK